jgi:putative membrane protein
MPILTMAFFEQRNERGKNCMFKIIIYGMLMSSADAIPGVSGSTVAFILGFYDEFLGALHNCISKDRQLRKQGIIYILKLLPGFTIGMILTVLILGTVVEKHCYFLSSLFMGLTVISIPFLAIQEKEVLSRNYKDSLFILLGIALSVGMYFLRDVFSISVIDFHALRSTQYVYVFVVCAFGMASMILPGISGSSLLLILGVYTPMLTAAKDLLHLDFTVLPGLAIGVLGMLVGSLLSIKSVKSFIENHRCAAMYLILGLIAGSVYAIIQAPSIRADPLPPLSIHTFSIWGFLVGAALIGLLVLMKGIKTKK